MQQYLAQIALVVKDYDEAIQYYTQVLGFELLEDTVLSETKRWVRVMPKGAKETAFLLAKAATPEQELAIGNQTGGRVFLFLYTTDFENYYNHLKQHGVVFTGDVRHEAYGKVVVFKDLYGNLWDLIEPRNT